jgi:hypothetical protein
VQKESSDEELLQFKLFLAIGANDKYMLVEVLTVPYQPHHYVYRAEKFATSVKTSGFFSPRLELEWPEFSMSNKYSPLQFSLPQFCKLKRTQANLARKILSDNHHILLFTKTANGTFQLVPLQDTIWAQQNSNHENSASLAPRPPVLPRPTINQNFAPGS